MNVAPSPFTVAIFLSFKSRTSHATTTAPPYTWFICRLVSCCAAKFFMFVFIVVVFVDFEFCFGPDFCVSTGVLNCRFPIHIPMIRKRIPFSYAFLRFSRTYELSHSVLFPPWEGFSSNQAGKTGFNIILVFGILFLCEFLPRQRFPKRYSRCSSSSFERSASPRRSTATIFPSASSRKLCGMVSIPNIRNRRS